MANIKVFLWYKDNDHPDADADNTHVMTISQLWTGQFIIIYGHFF